MTVQHSPTPPMPMPMPMPELRAPRRLDSRAERVALVEAIAAMTPEGPQTDGLVLLREARDA